jgi:alkylation response protein AidB-like acyl-CoA dehydrogenase
MDGAYHDIAVGLATEADRRREELSRDRRIPSDLFRRAGEAGLFRQLLPSALGGLALSPAEWFLTGVDMARWEPSFAWVVTQGAADMATYIAAGTRAFADAFLSDPCAYSASSDNVSGSLIAEADGYRVEGRWGFCSGCQGSTWLGGFCAPSASDAGDHDGRWVLVPAGQARIDETWDTIGMIGTGSHTVTVPPQYVPRDWTFVLVEPGPEDYGPVSAAAGNGYWPIATAVGAVQLGIARRALDEGVAHVQRKRDARSGGWLSGNAHVQRQLMQAEAAWLAAHASVEAALGQFWDDAQRSRTVLRATLVRLALANVHAARTGTEIVQTICDLAGTSVAPARGIFGACLRDARTMGSHIAVNPSKLETIAGIRFGIVPGDVPF